MVKTAIIGASGYTGVELIRLLAMHTEVELSVITSDSESGKKLGDVFPAVHNHKNLTFSKHDSNEVNECDLVFFATPHAVSMHIVPKILEQDIKVIDLSADYRIKDIETWQEWYGCEHITPQLVEQAAYGLPEINRQQIKNAQLVANPGCYPTASSLALIPALHSKLIDPTSIIIDAKSGFSGAGRKASQAGLFSEVSETFKAYGLPGHRHLPEIIQTLNSVSEKQVEVTFVPHLLPINRGILATVYVEQVSSDDLFECYSTYYANEPFVEILQPGSLPDTRSTRGTNHCRISLFPDAVGSRTVIVSVIDNLVKGAAGQAIQNMNIMFGFDEQIGLRQDGFYP